MNGYSKIESAASKKPLLVEYTENPQRALDIMNAFDIRHLPVMRDGELVGVISDRDIYMNRANSDPHVGEKVGDIMTKNPYRIKKGTPLGKVAKIMAENKIGSALITDEKNKIIGIFTTTDALRVIARHFDYPNEKDNVFFMNIEDYLKCKEAVSSLHGTSVS